MVSERAVSAITIIPFIKRYIRCIEITSFTYTPHQNLKLVLLWNSVANIPGHNRANLRPRYQPCVSDTVCRYNMIQYKYKHTTDKGDNPPRFPTSTSHITLAHRPERGKRVGGGRKTRRRTRFKAKHL